ncbi:histidine phosphatase family protein [Candidatus Colwellia aromaticivorans]|uniref:histidine phosphatase family protein n=1 Tax=Candidatus Colwellia aromaticivorans TaxID=2267621 RepID=UPI000DF4C872|nr:histidine phosphatase family protein [Candidatus Colwellia aromaticivorans]
MKTNLYLARHGQTQWNKVQRFQGRLDSELTEMGKQQSEKLAQHLANQQIDLIISSSLGRAVNSALICQKTLNIPIVSLDELTERDLGHWQGQYVDDIKVNENYNEIFHQFSVLKPKNGESAINCGTRIYKTIKVLANNHINKNLLIIFHGEALRCFLAKLGHQSTNNAYELFANGCTFHLTYNHEDERFKMPRESELSQAE